MLLLARSGAVFRALLLLSCMICSSPITAASTQGESSSSASHTKTTLLPQPDDRDVTEVVILFKAPEEQKEDDAESSIRIKDKAMARGNVFPCPYDSVSSGRRCVVSAISRLFRDVCRPLPRRHDFLPNHLRHIFYQWGACPLDSVCVQDKHIDLDYNPQDAPSVTCVAVSQLSRISWADEWVGRRRPAPETDSDLVDQDLYHRIRVLRNFGPAGNDVAMVLFPHFVRDMRPQTIEVGINSKREKIEAIWCHGCIGDPPSSSDSECDVERIWDSKDDSSDEDWQQTNVKWLPPPTRAQPDQATLARSRELQDADNNHMWLYSDSDTDNSGTDSDSDDDWIPRSLSCAQIVRPTGSSTHELPKDLHLGQCSRAGGSSSSGQHDEQAGMTVGTIEQITQSSQQLAATRLLRCQAGANSVSIKLKQLCNSLFWLVASCLTACDREGSCL